ncbi:acetate--CoA ligase [Candidatus Uabimicrobium amorphum]|uniref:acetate--CoA ligase n=1 Tax=Uabimicrobium amorphum TaxID=2596890 RepID=A0A5S9IRI5_UABAM|nr:acetate--CoA ligase [Candidatus Uabimicrobium amorphum]BBM85830.1 acetate--CoA ligase [Candidatus Uabimicrobium amorphum]
MDTIYKKTDNLPVKPNLQNYKEERTNFSWEQAKNELSSENINMAYQAIDRHVATPLRDHVALRWLGKKGESRDFTFAEMSRESNRFANVLKNLGIKKGERVFGLCGRIPELYIAILGTLKNLNVFCPLFSAFGPDPILARMQIGDGKVLITTASLYRKKIAKIRDQLPKLEHVIIIADPQQETENTHNFSALMEKASDDFSIEKTDPEDMALLHFTSGTTGKPKGAIHVHQAVIHHHISGKYALDFQPQDIYWCTADPGWVTGLSYGVISPWTNGVTNLIDEADFNVRHWYQVLQDQKVTIWYSAPTAIRMLMKAGLSVVKEYNFPHLRHVVSVGEPLNPEAVVWGEKAFGLPIHDTWWQTETGGIMIANYPAVDIKPGSMGYPMPGIEAVIVKHEDSSVSEIDTPEEVGELAIKVSWPSMFRGYLHEEGRYKKCFSGQYYFSGDLAKKDSDGCFWFVGRADDVINSSGHLISPFEIESILLEHEAVAEAGVIAKPDQVVMEYPKAFVALKPGFNADETLEKQLRGFIRKRMGATVAPKEIEFLPSLPKTKSGKIMRRLLKARELGLPEGDTSTLETNL